MKARDVLAALPAETAWTVMFRLATVRRFVDDPTVRAMFFLPVDVPLDGASHVVLSAAGRFLAADGLLDVGEGVPAIGPMGSMLDRHAAAVADVETEADCLGLGSSDGRPAAVLSLRIGADGYGEALARFAGRPPVEDYDLLAAVGVHFLGAEVADGRCLARFRHRLPTHVQAGRLAGFTRTHHCNDFFFNHGDVDATLRDGLLKASADRLRLGREIAAAVVQKLALAGGKRALPMIAEPPPPEAPFAYGDLVPRGLLLRALEDGPAPSSALGGFQHRLVTDETRSALDAQKQDGLWAFHSGRLPTCTDSALVLLGRRDPVAIAELEGFADGHGRYVPQLWSAEGGPMHMRAGAENAHWRQPDSATTFLVAGLRAEAGLPALTPTALLEADFETRSGLYFANPWLVDWTLALALRGREDGASLRARLRRELLDSANEDGSFGTFDRPLSTALAILALGALGHRGRAVRLAQLRTLELLEPQPWPASHPFYSTFLSPDVRPVDPLPAQHVLVAGAVHELTLYRDESRAILAAMLALAVQVECDMDAPDAEARRVGPAHARYRCATGADYVAQHALPPYARVLAAS